MKLSRGLFAGQISAIAPYAIVRANIIKRLVTHSVMLRRKVDETTMKVSIGSWSVALNTRAGLEAGVGSIEPMGQFSAS
jgi:hypothetical protein